MMNGAGRELPEALLDKHKYRPYSTVVAQRPMGHMQAAPMRNVRPGEDKLSSSLREALTKAGVKNGMTLSFHHHFRSGDHILNLVMAEIDRMGIRDITLFPSSLSDIHEPLVDMIRRGVVSKIHTSGLRGPLAVAVSNGLMEEPVVIRSHGGRARAIECGDMKIDIAIMGVPCSDPYGNANGSGEHVSCGSLGYAMVDVKYADTVILLTDNLVPYPNIPASISQIHVDHVVQVESIGDPKGIASGATRYSRNPKELLIAERASEAIIHSGYFKDGFSFQTGSGGSSLAVTRYLKSAMIQQSIKASFALGGISQPMVEMLQEGLIGTLFDVQSFDLIATDSITKNPNHVEIDAGTYASPFNGGCVANMLDVVILSALEVDTDFNVNVMTGSDGILRGASGGHSDTAASAKLTVVVAPLIRSRIPTVVERVNTVITPGESVDIVVTDRGTAVNPKRTDLIEILAKNGIQTTTIGALKELAYGIAGTPHPIEYEDRVVAIVEYRDGSVMDVVRQVKVREENI